MKSGDLYNHLNTENNCLQKFSNFEDQKQSLHHVFVVLHNIVKFSQQLCKRVGATWKRVKQSTRKQAFVLRINNSSGPKDLQYSKRFGRFLAT